MYRVILCTLVICLAVAACSGKATPDPTEVARAVEATLAAHVRRATPIPIHTSSPTTTPTATPAALVPAGWKQYEDIDGLFAFMYPPNWEISSQMEKQIVFSLPGRSASVVVSVDVGEDFDAVGTNDEDILTRLAAVEAYALTTAEADDIKLLAKGIWKDQGYLLEYTFRDNDAEAMEYVIYVPFGLGRYARLMLMFFRPNGTVTAEELGSLNTVVSTLRVNQPMISEPSQLTIKPTAIHRKSEAAAITTPTVTETPLPTVTPTRVSTAIVRTPTPTEPRKPPRPTSTPAPPTSTPTPVPPTSTPSGCWSKEGFAACLKHTYDHIAGQKLTIIDVNIRESDGFNNVSIELDWSSFHFLIDQPGPVQLAYAQPLWHDVKNYFQGKECSLFVWRISFEESLMFFNPDSEWIQYSDEPRWEGGKLGWSVFWYAVKGYRFNIQGKWTDSLETSGTR